MADTLSRAAGPSQLASGTSTLFTGTTAHTYTILSLVVVNTSASAVTFKAGIGGVADSNLFIQSITIPAGGRLDFETKVVFAGTETVQVNAGAATSLTATLTVLDQS